MKLKYIYASITLLSILLMTGCFEKDSYDPVREVAFYMFYFTFNEF